jgi:hypothetical protein
MVGPPAGGLCAQIRPLCVSIRSLSVAVVKWISRWFGDRGRETGPAYIGCLLLHSWGCQGPRYAGNLSLPA